MSKQPVLETFHVKKTFPSTEQGGAPLSILDGVNLSVYAGEKTAIVGQSGSGKSTLLHILGLLDAPSYGEISLAGEKTSEMSDAEKSNLRNQEIGFVYQNHHLLKEFTALENVALPSLIGGKADKARAQAFLEKVGLKNRAGHFPAQLSGGEQQRVALARALMNRPKLLLADEPTGSLDPKTAEEIEALFDTLIQEENMAMLLVTHNMALAKKCDACWRMEKGKLVKNA